MFLEISEKLQKQAQSEVLACPVCKGQLNGGAVLVCPVCQLQFGCNNGIWHFLTQAQTAEYNAFLENYRFLRQGDGWEQPDDSYYLSLPFLPPSYGDKNLQFVWRIRQRSFGILQQQAGTANGAWALDVGAGNGWLSRRLSENGWRVLALDLHTEGRDSLQGGEIFLGHGANFVRGQATMAALPVQNEAVGLVVSSGAFHYTDSAEALAEIYRVLKPGGRAIINDSPTFTTAKDGDGMVADQAQRLAQTHGREPLLTGGRGYILLPEFSAQAAQLGFKLDIFWPERPGATLKRTLRQILHPQQRAQARFPVFVLSKVEGRKSKVEGREGVASPLSLVSSQGKAQVQAEGQRSKVESQPELSGIRYQVSANLVEGQQTSPKIQFSPAPNPQPLTPTLAVFGICLIINYIGLWLKPFDGLYGQDAYAYYAHSVELSERFSLFHHWQWEEQARLLYWPFGYPLLVALFFKIAGTGAGLAQFVSMLAWAGTAALTTALAQRTAASLLPKSNTTIVGLVAGLMVALSPLGRQAAVTVMADAATLFWTVLAIWLALSGRQDGKNGRLIAAGAALGLACVTRFFAVTALPVLLLIVFWPDNKRPKIVALVWSAVALGLICLPQIIINIIYPDPLWSNSWLAQWTPANWLRGDFVTREGLALYDQPPLIFNLVGTLFSPRFLTPAVVPLLAIGLLVSFATPRKVYGWLLVGWWLLPVLLLAGMPYENERYSLTFLPPIAILAALGVGWLWNKLDALPVINKKIWLQSGFAGLILVGFIGLGWLSQRHLNGFITTKDADLAVVRAAENFLPANAKLITFGVSLTFDHYARYPVRDLYFLDAAKIDALRATPGTTYLLADTADMRGQWKDTGVGAAFEAAVARSSGAPIAQFGIYQLWKL